MLHLLFRYANRHDFIVRPSDCTPRVIPSFSQHPPSQLPRLPIFLLFVHQTESSCCSATATTATTASVVAAVARQQKISNKSFRNPASLLSASPDFHYLAFMPPPHPPKTLPLFSSVSPYRSPVKRDSTILPSLSVSFPGLTLPYFRHFFFSFFYPFLSNLSVMPLLARSRSASRFFFFFSAFIPPVRIFRLHNFAEVSSFWFELKSARGACPDRICFVCFSCATLNRDFLAIHAYHHYDIWRRKLQLKWGPPGFETTFVTVGSANRNWSSCCWGTRQRDLLKQYEQRDFFKLFVFLSFLAKSRAIASFYHARVCMYVCVWMFSAFLWYIYRAIIASSNAFSLGSDHRPFELYRAILWLLIAIKERPFRKYEKIRDFFSVEGGSCLYPRTVSLLSGLR